MGRKNERSRRNTKKNTRRRRMDIIGKNTSRWARQYIQQIENRKAKRK